MRLVVVGLGYLGTTHAACMAELGHEVLGIETDRERFNQLAGGHVPFFEPGLEALVKKHLDSGRLKFSLEYADAAAFANVFFIAVGTPQKKGEYGADLTAVEGSIKELVGHIAQESIILGKSTVPVGTTSRLNKLLEAEENGSLLEIAWNPEFLREGHGIDDTLRPNRIVVGAEENSKAVDVCREIYREAIDSGTPYIVTDPATAELVKTSANAFLATKVSFINAIAEICEAVGADVRAVAEAMGHDQRIGRQYLNAGLGFGGGCLPKDIRAFMARAGELGAAEALAFLREVDAVNMRRRSRLVDLAKSACDGGLIGKRIAVLGTSFKPNSDDVRDSPALNVAGQLQLQGASVFVYDPRAMSNSRKLFPTLEYAGSAIEACTNADVVLILTEWPEFAAIRPQDLNAVVRCKRIVDGRLCLDPTVWRSGGWSYYV